MSVVDTILKEDMDAYTRLTDSILHQILGVPAAVEVHNYTDITFISLLLVN